MYLTIEAVGLSEKYRTPVILLMDETVAHMRQRVTLPDPKDVKLVERKQYLDLGDLPEFVYKPINIVDSVRNSLFDIVILVMANVLFFSLSFLAFIRYDVR